MIHDKTKKIQEWIEEQENFSEDDKDFLFALSENIYMQNMKITQDFINQAEKVAMEIHKKEFLT